MANSGDFAYTLKEQADIVRIIGEYVKLRKSGRRTSRDCARSIRRRRRRFRCMPPTVFPLLWLRSLGRRLRLRPEDREHHLPGSRAADRRKARSIPLPKMQYASPEESRGRRSMRGGLIDINERACAFFQEQLRKPEATHAREYLASRGLTPEISPSSASASRPIAASCCATRCAASSRRRADARVGTVLVEG